MAFIGEELSQFDETKIKSNDGEFLPIPPGWYVVRVVTCELKDSASGGQYLNFRFDIVAPAHQGRVLWGKLNIKNHNADVEGRARRDMILINGGIPKDTDNFIGKEIAVKVAIEYSDYHKKDQNEIKAYKSAVEGSEAKKPSAPANAAGLASSVFQTTGATGKKVAPWAGKK